MDQDAGISREELRARGADGQSGQSLPAARRGVRRGRLREDAALRARLAGLRGLLSQPPLAAFQGAELLRVVVDDGGRGGVRRPQQHDRRACQHLQHVQAEDDRRLHDLHGGSHRRRPQRLHQDGKGEGLGACGIRRSVRAYAGLRRQPHHRLRQRDERHPRAFLGRQGRHGAQAGTPAEREDQLHRRVRRLHGRQHPRDQAHLRADGVEYTVLADNSDVFDTPTDGEFRMYDGGTTLEDAANAIHAKATISMQQYCTEKTLPFIAGHGQEVVVIQPSGRGVGAPTSS